ncbi:hypothetical protein TcWFU_000515 [Taenia crassiceps]|uniref:Secreted protein n=1 Tax=Taenia crassiceps TaxID=6207 RepID=A0ABR4Q7S8_9CEST
MLLLSKSVPEFACVTQLCDPCSLLLLLLLFLLLFFLHSLPPAPIGSGEIGDEMWHRRMLRRHFIGVHLALKNHLFNNLALVACISESSNLKSCFTPHPFLHPPSMHKQMVDGRGETASAFQVL